MKKHVQKKAVTDTTFRVESVTEEKGAEHIEKMLKNKEVQKFLKETFMPVMRRLAEDD